MNFKLGRKISLIIGLIVLFVVLSIGMISTSFGSKILQSSQEEYFLNIANEDAKYVQGIIDSRLQILNELTLRDSVKSMEWVDQKNELLPDVERLKYLDIGIVTPDGTANYVKTGETADLSDREYIKKALNGEPNVSNVLISKVTNSPVIMYAVPIKVNNQIKGALIARRDGTELNDITDELGFGKRGYSFVIREDATLYSHPDRDLVLEQINVL